MGCSTPNATAGSEIYGFQIVNGRCRVEEQRQVRRQRTILGGIVSFNRRRSTSDCTIRNLSEGGALLVFENATLLPAEFDLTIAAKETTVRARTVWRGPSMVGVSFVSRERTEPVALDVARRLRAAKAENAALRQRIADLST